MEDIQQPQLDMRRPEFDCNSWCSSFLEENIGHSFIWNIQQFSNFNKPNQEFIKSACFTVKGEKLDSKWSIILYPNGHTSENEGHIAVFLQCENPSTTTVKKYSVRIVDKNGNPIHGFHGTNSQFNSHNGFRRPTGGYWGRSFISRDLLEKKKEEFLNNDTLTLLCFVQVVGKQVDHVGVNHFDKTPKEIGVDVCRQKLSEDLEELFESEEEADVEIACRGRIFYCHKLILVARSPVFKAMFVHNMKEQSSHRVDILDMEPLVLKEMLRFLYTGSCVILTHTRELLAASEKYSLPQLKLKCEAELCLHVDLDNCLDHLLLADLYNLVHLKKEALQLVAENICLLIHSNQWARDIQNNAALLAQIVSVIAFHKTV